MPEHADRQFLAADMGGTSNYNHAEWLLEQFEHEEVAPDPKILANIEVLRQRHVQTSTEKEHDNT